VFLLSRFEYIDHRALSGNVLDWPHFGLKIAPSRVGIWTPSNVWFLGPIQVYIPNSIFISSAIFAQLPAVPILCNEPPLLPLKIAVSHAGSGPPSITWFPGHHYQFSHLCRSSTDDYSKLAMCTARPTALHRRRGKRCEQQWPITGQHLPKRGEEGAA